MAQDPERRDVVELSLRRSERFGVDPAMQFEGIATMPIFDADERLRRSLKPILDGLVQRLSSLQAGLVLTDDRAVVIDRRVTSTAMATLFDHLSILTGSVFDEEHVGTNASGTAIEARRMVRIIGAEHYTHTLQQFCCYGIPLYQPTTRRLVGALVLALGADADHPLLAAFVDDAARKIETLLAGETSARERAQMDCFWALSRRARGAVLATMDDAVLLNRHAEQFDPVDRSVLLRAAAGIVPADHGTLIDLGEIAASGPLTVRVHTRTDDLDFPGVVLEAVTPAPRTHIAAPRRGLPGLVGESAAWHAVCEQVRSALAADVAILIVGEAGVGKAAIAGAAHRLAGRELVREHDVAAVTVDGARNWLRALRTDLEPTAGGAVLRRIDLCDAGLAAKLCAEFDRWGPGARLVATATDVAAVPRSLLDRFPVQVRVPPLRARREDVDPLVRALLLRPSIDPTLRFRPDALAVLRAAELNGNARELERLVAGVAAVRSAGDVTAADLTDVEASGPRHLTPLQRAEREAIVTALAYAGGNKRTAAKELGVSRTTLYRRLEEYRIDAP